MSDVTINAGTPEEVAYKLYMDILYHKNDSSNLGEGERIELYAKCLKAVRNPAKARTTNVA